MIEKIKRSLFSEVSIAPLVVFRIAFGALMFLSTLRFILKGWVYDLYVKPAHYFPFYGFEWVKPIPEFWTYALFAIMLIASLFILLGLFYRISSLCFFAVGHLRDRVNENIGDSFASQVWTFTKALVPDFEIFNLKSMASYGLTISGQEMALAGGYAAICVTFYLLAAALCFNHKDIAS